MLHSYGFFRASRIREITYDHPSCAVVGFASSEGGRGPGEGGEGGEGGGDGDGGVHFPPTCFGHPAG